jgi:hypothetical protein
MARKIISGTLIPDYNNSINEEQAIIQPETTEGELDTLIGSIPEGTSTPSSSGGFTLTFTSGKEYDLDKIIASIRRDNSEKALIMKVNIESELVQAIIDRCIEELKIMYHADSLELILDYKNIFNNYFEEKFDEYRDEAARAGISEGELLINEAQDKIEVTNADLIRYLLSDKPKSGAVKPILDHSKTFAVWNELGDGDLTESEDIDTKEIYEARISALQELIDNM